VTAKDFRTWAATNLAALALQQLEIFDTQAKAKKNVLQAVESVSKMLGNTPAICRKCYIHPAIFDGYLDGRLLQALKQRTEEKLADPGHGLKAEEVAVVAFLARQLDQPTLVSPTGQSDHGRVHVKSPRRRSTRRAAAARTPAGS